MQELTARQQEILDLIKTHIEDTGYPPTRAEIADQLGFKSANAAEEHLKALARKGAIEMVARTQSVSNGQIVVARIDNEVTVKRYKKGRSAHQLTLLPENEDFEPIEVDLREQDCSIEGISVGVIRR